MKIVHFSDWHSAFQRHKLPFADVYVCTGDMYPNFPELICYGKKPFIGSKSYLVGQDKIPSFVRPIGRVIHKDWEKQKQLEWVENNWPDGKIRELFDNPYAPVVCVRGNHDFISLSHLFVGGDCFEIIEPEDVFTIDGKRFGGMRGINYIAGEWADELCTNEAKDLARRMPLDLDVLVTHAPPRHILDYDGDHYGMDALRDYTNRAMYAGRSFCHMFGHIHSFGKMIDKTTCEGIVFSNGATDHNVMEI